MPGEIPDGHFEKWLPVRIDITGLERDHWSGSCMRQIQRRLYWHITPHCSRSSAMDFSCVGLQPCAPKGCVSTAVWHRFSNLCKQCREAKIRCYIVISHSEIAYGVFLDSLVGQITSLLHSIANSLWKSWRLFSPPHNLVCQMMGQSLGGLCSKSWLQKVYLKKFVEINDD